MLRSTNVLRLQAVGAAAVCLGVSATVRADVTSAAVKAVWQVQEIHLPYFGFTTHYSCDSLRDKVHDAIMQLGAREDSIVSIAGCDELSGPARMPSVRIVMATPTTDTARLQDKNRAELLARMQRKGQAPQSDESFDAIRKTVVLPTKGAGSSSIVGDCELLEHVRDKIVKKMDARVVRDDLRCVPNQGTVGNPKLTVEVLAKK
jgi:hypothetical protein